MGSPWLWNPCSEYCALMHAMPSLCAFDWESYWHNVPYPSHILIQVSLMKSHDNAKVRVVVDMEI